MVHNTFMKIFYFISDNDRYTYEPKGLRIKSITEDDNGQYTCRAEVEEDGRLEERVIDVIVHSMFSSDLRIWEAVKPQFVAKLFCTSFTHVIGMGYERQKGHN